MDDTPNLKLPYIAAAQSQKHVTHNEAIRALDCLVGLAVLSRALATPPTSPADGDRYIVGAAAVGVWAGKSGQIAAWQDGAWAFYAPREGWIAWVANEDLACAFDGAAWISAAANALNPVPMVGINTTADTTNRLALKAPATLLDNDGAGHQLKLNKHAGTDTASLLLQDGYSGRAEIGLAGDDNLHVKVSADGSAWIEAIVIDRTTGAVTLPHTAAGAQVNADWNAASGVAQVLNKPSLGTAAAKNTGTAAGNVVVLDGSGKLPAIDGSQLTNLAGGTGGGSSTPPVRNNLLINGDFRINQRGFAGGGLAAGAYGFDRWKADTGGATCSLSEYTLTLSSGTLVQAIENAQWGVYSWSGQTMTVSVESPSAALTVSMGNAAGSAVVSGTIPAGSGRQSCSLAVTNNDVVTCFRIASQSGASATFGRVKLEAGTSASAWEMRPTEKLLAWRYYYRVANTQVFQPLAILGQLAGGNQPQLAFRLPVTMRAAPTIGYSSLGDLHLLKTDSNDYGSLTAATFAASADFVTITNIAVSGATNPSLGQATVLAWQYPQTTAKWIDASAEL